MGNSPASSPGRDENDGFGSRFFDTATSALCGNVNDTVSDDYSDLMPTPKKKSLPRRLWETADTMCISSPINSDRKDGSFLGTDDDEGDSMVEPKRREMKHTSALFARALVSEVTDNPRTMTPAAMAEREKRLLKAQQAARKQATTKTEEEGPKPVGAPGGVGQPSLLGSIKHALGHGGGSFSSDDGGGPAATPAASVLPPNSLRENRAQATAAGRDASMDNGPKGKYGITIGLSLSRRHSTVGHPDTVTRQTAFDFNELQDRQYKYVSSTDSSGWLAGGGERGGAPPTAAYSDSEDEQIFSGGRAPTPVSHKVAAPDTVHIPIIHINAESPAAVDAIISALARGEVFIPHMGVSPETLSVNGVSPPDLVVSFGCERNEDTSPEEWPNWCLEFMHNQLYEYFENMGAQWMRRPFQITLARKVRWKTVKHMNRYFAHAERVVDAWRDKGPQYLDPQLSYIEGGATPEEVARPHGIYLMRNGVPTNYFAPNFDPPYTTKMTRSLLMNVLGKSWDKKRREWTSEPVPRLITPSMLMGAMCGCAETETGFMANEVTNGFNHSPPTQEYKSLNDAARAQMQAISKNADPALAVYDAMADMSLKEEKKADSKDEWSPSKASPASPLVSEVGTESTARSSPAVRASPQSRAAPSQPIPPNRRYGPSPSPERGRFTRATREEAVAPSDVGMMSVAATETTVQHMNSDPRKIMERDVERRQQLEREKREMKEKEAAEGWLREALEEETGEEEYFTSDGFDLKSDRSPQNGNPISSNTKSAQKAKHISLVGKENVAGTATAGPGAKYLMNANGKNSSSTQPEVQRSDSGSVSLEYSLDSSLLGDGSLIGHKFDGDGSVNTRTSRATDASNTTANSQIRTAEKDQDEERTADGSLTIQESTSSNEPVPTDEELFAIGWAKALDPSSGSHYYFTLDRSKTVWENPLNPSSVFSDATSSLQSI